LESLGSRGLSAVEKCSSERSLSYLLAEPVEAKFSPILSV